jgi:sulfite reductase (NADPH) flavoprotein alpha-component
MAEDAPRFDQVRYAVLALGDRAYAQFCETGRQFDERFAALGGQRIAERVECDLDYKPAAKVWTDATLRGLAETLELAESQARGVAESKTAASPASSWPAQTGPARQTGGGAEPLVARAESAHRAPAAPVDAGVIRVDFLRGTELEDDADEASAVPAEVNALINLNSSRSDVQTFHVELSLAGSGLSYEPGDSIGFVPENDPALVEEIARIAGLSGDATITEALARRLDITTLTRTQIGQYATLTGDATLQALAADPVRAQEFVRDRQVIDLLAAVPTQMEPDQLVSLLRPLPARLYSVASSQAAVGEEAHLLVARVEWDSHGRARKGVASNQVAERLAVGGSLPITVKPNPHFRLPADESAPVIMIGPGTGVAPFRAFLQQREATGADGRNWLFFGARRFTHDFLYQLEWQDWLASGVLNRIDLAFSRDQAGKIYVQHRIWDARRDLYAWLQDGAYLYVCGDAKAMAKDVHATLLRVISDQGGRDAAGAAAFLRGLQQAGRYLRDVY